MHKERTFDRHSRTNWIREAREQIIYFKLSYKFCLNIAHLIKRKKGIANQISYIFNMTGKNDPSSS